MPTRTRCTATLVYVTLKKGDGLGGHVCATRAVTLLFEDGSDERVFQLAGLRNPLIYMESGLRRRDG